MNLTFPLNPILSHILSNSTILMSFLVTPFKVFIADAARTQGTLVFIADEAHTHGTS